MLEHIPAWLGHALVNVRAGAEKLTVLQPGLVDIGHATLELSSPAFAQDAMMPARFTADGEGVSPPLVWSAPPTGTASFALLVEDADAPALQPLVHAIIWGIPADTGRLAEGAIVAEGAGDAQGDVGRNSYLREGWLPPDPPTGHGDHRYAFQLFALDATTPDPGDSPGRGALVEAMTGHVLAAGLLVGRYARGAVADAPVTGGGSFSGLPGSVAPA
ncbi:phosphatidylethanolamine-binding protein [Sphingomonas sp. Leaf17]|uniref:YbhB/YbcL family Raf kinase inhibitor-like protein n=1 Tax=Sphingomonas sp. Leaf17 TaxID=1735683 RepID=UPI0006F38346|nr:YbhB/YbcL family Raf kinase inhibitor-like protein [Sphingomonas sp. Leaf17]KQM64392.1 phosphatidylethanolamine-binding protein [Sphingomonas sp. Leaf17]